MTTNLTDIKKCFFVVVIDIIPTIVQMYWCTTIIIVIPSGNNYWANLSGFAQNLLILVHPELTHEVYKCFTVSIWLFAAVYMTFLLQSLKSKTSGKLYI